MRGSRLLGWVAATLLAALVCGCAHVTPVSVAAAGAGDVGVPVPAQNLTARFTLNLDGLLLNSVDLDIQGGQIRSAKMQTAMTGLWRLSLRPDPRWAGLAVISAERVGDAASPGGIVSVWLDARMLEGKLVLTPVLAEQKLMATVVGGALQPAQQTLAVEMVCSVGGVALPAVPADSALALRWVLADLKQATDPALLMLLSDYLWHHGDLDTPPGSFNTIIRLHYRVVELDPQATPVYTTTAWLLWSKWVSWKMDPLKMPDGKSKVKEALKLLKRGEKANPGNAEYLCDSGTTMMSLARFHRADLYPFVFDQLKKADQNATAEQTKLKVRVRLTIAHNYRHLKQWDDAATWYRAVLELDPQNEVATRCLKQVTSGQPEGEPAAAPAPASAVPAPAAAK